MTCDKKVLYVDDEPNNLFLFESVFSSKFVLYTATSGPEGLSVLEENSNIEVVISDMKMADMNGVEFILEARNKYPNIKYYILTAYGMNSILEKALNEGIIDQYLQKPFDFDHIEKVILNK